jgi:ABC-2 type transport system ATP-binding protein
VRLGDADVAKAWEALCQCSWTYHVEQVAERTLRVDAETLEARERGIPAALAGCGARLVSSEPLAADLESAFLALTREEGP